MNAFVQRYQSAVTGVLSGFDRVRLRGTLRMLAHAGGFASFLRIAGVKLAGFAEYVEGVTDRVRRATERVAAEAGRPVIYVPKPSTDKEALARGVAARDGAAADADGLVCVLRSVEPCWSYDVRKWGSPELKGGVRKCLHYYHYFDHPTFGFMHVRLQSWFPLSVSVCLNGREWLARAMDAEGVAYRRADNCFPAVADVARAQALLDGQLRTDWPAALGALMRQVNPAHDAIFESYPHAGRYYWSADQTEWATDVMFRDPASLAAVYPGLVRHGMLNLGSRDVLRFLGRPVAATGRLHPGLAAEVASDLGRRAEGVRVKHRVGANSVKMYDKQRTVLRVEATVNDPAPFKVYRPKAGDPAGEGGAKAWRPLRKGVADLFRRAEVSQAANERYLTAMAAAAQPVPLKDLAEPLCRPATYRGPKAARPRRVRALNPLAAGDAALLAAVSRGEFAVGGFRNRDLRPLLYTAAAAARAARDTEAGRAEARRQSSAVTRRLRMLRAHSLVKRVPRTHRYLLTDAGRRAITAVLEARAADAAKLAAAA